MTTGVVRALPAIASAIATGRAVVALESSVLAQGLPIPANRTAARNMIAAVDAAGAVAAITAVVRGIPTAGLTEDELERFLARDGVEKVSARDLARAVARGADGATTVAAAIALAHLAGISVLATGGIGGVHRAPPYDESADLAELARTPMIVVCSGAKAILDLRATAERLDTLGVPIVGYRTAELPAFYGAESGIPVPRVDDVQEIVAVFQAQRALGRRSSLLVVQPPPAPYALPGSVVERAIVEGIRESTRAGVQGAAITPFLLAYVDNATAGRAREVNLALLEQNAALAGSIAVALAATMLQ
ncbi:MAG TPA: pseudouridine-5'-phosphate glycosidase [Gemmatimonadaceae bacterium]|jgi:pseudouridine-5'-phosphate glycosidase|nr:pseudouridine-5'-phosphate glycosidase [Gemmatimonadaceae bacterium]